MKIALAQLNYNIGNFELNKDKIISAINKGKLENADLIVFSELAICGYPPHDLLERREFIAACEDAMHEVAKHCKTIAAIVGGPSINPNDKGKRLHNSAWFLADGKVKSLFHKTLLPTYDVFDEYRYFEPNSTFEILHFKDKKIALTICEDIWDKQPVANPFAQSRLYATSPMANLMKHKPDLMINIAASPFSYVQEGSRKKVVLHNATTYQLPVIYVNQTGAQTELIFDGNSLVLNAKGELVAQLNRFEEDFKVVDTDSLHGEKLSIPEKPNHIPIIYDALVLGIKDYFQKMGFSKATLGLSGGIDSAVTLALAVEALGNENVRVLLMPSQYSSNHSVKDAEDMAKTLNIKYDIVPIVDIFNAFNNSLSPIFQDRPFNVAEENIQARIRGVLMMGLSNKFGNILLNTSNKSEAAVGYGTLYGDMNGGLSVLGDVYKTDVFTLARYINKDMEIIPENTISKPPSAELRPDQKDSDSLPEYDILDGILFNYIELNRSPEEIETLGYNKEIIAKVIRLVNMNEYKRFQTAPTLRVSSKAFGFGRRIPLVAKY